MTPDTPHWILVVEDDADIGTMLCDLLELYGYAVQFANSGQQAIAILRDDHVPLHAVLLDHDLPDLTGADVLDATSDQRPGLPVLLLSARYDGAALARTLNVSCYIRKPFDPQRLVSQLAACIADGWT